MGSRFWPRIVLLSLYEIVAELLFALLPIMVLMLNRAFAGESIPGLLKADELLLVSAVLFGQAIAKYVARAIKTKAETSRAVLIVSAMIVLGLVPQLITLSWALNGGTIRVWLQLAFMGISIIIFLVLGRSVISLRSE